MAAVCSLLISWLRTPLPNPILDVVSELFLASKTEQRSPLLDQRSVRSTVAIKMQEPRWNNLRPEVEWY